jgi:hypothetical protein
MEQPGKGEIRMSTVTTNIKQVPLPELSVDLHELAETLPAEDFALLKQVREFIWRKVLLDRMNRPIQQTRAGVVRKQTSVCNRH